MDEEEMFEDKNLFLDDDPEDDAAEEDDENLSEHGFHEEEPESDF
jgi:hypothetical protein